MSDDKVRIPLLCCKVHGERVSRCIKAEFVDSAMTSDEIFKLGRELYEFLYANAPSSFVDGLLDMQLTKRAPTANENAL